MAKNQPKPSLLNLSVEEENLAAIPFAVLERRVGKRIGKIEVHGRKMLPDGREMEVLWQVQGNNELGLPTEKDLDIFVALGVLTFRGNFSKTVSFSGPEIAKILNVRNVHGKFYHRLKLAMDRFIPLRFRALAATDHQEEVKWLNVFQEASFSLDRISGRCTGTVTWTDKLIHSMDNGFFRVLDSGRYMQLDGITAKHLYRFVAVALESTNLIVIDARKLATQHLGIFHLPAYLSRLMQTLEPAFDQLIRIQVLGSYHIVDADNWRIALHRHAAYVPERKKLLQSAPDHTLSLTRENCQICLEKAGFSSKIVAAACGRFNNPRGLYQMQRAARLTEEFKQEGVVAHVAIGLVRRGLDADSEEQMASILDGCEIAIEVCRQKRNVGQSMKNLPGLIVKIARDPEGQAKLVNQESIDLFQRRFRDCEQAALRQAQEAEERTLILEYEEFRRKLAATLFEQMSSETRDALRREKSELIRQQERWRNLPAEAREREVDQMIIQDLSRKEAPPFERWALRRRARQIVLPFFVEQEAEPSGCALASS